MENFGLAFSLLSFLVLSSSHSSIAAAAAADEASSLIQFKKSSIEIDPKEFLQNWVAESNDPCSWTGVQCSQSDGSVQGLNLSSMGLVGRLQIDKLMALPALRDINLQGNFFSGDLDYDSSTAPSSCSFEIVDLSSNNFSEKISSSFLTSCTRLSSLNLSTNSIPAGVFPFGSSIRVLDVSRNKISDDGLLNYSLSSCRGLTHLNLSDNKFSGRLRSLPSSCAGLAVLDLSANSIYGEIPAGLAGACKTLIHLDLSDNQLTGGLPSGFSACSSLQILDLSNNHLSGNFVQQVVAKLASLQQLRLSFNNISGDLPLPSLAGCKHLEEIDLSANNFTGGISGEFCESLPSLQKLHLADNYISGSVPVELGNCTKLQSIHLSFNELVGEIPLQVWSLPNLVNIVMWANKLSGEIPGDLCSRNPNLEMLVLNLNALTGTIPESLGSCSKLIWVSLSGNQLNGNIPAEIGNLQNLAILQLGHNSLSGNIPQELGKCKNLIWLDLNSNQFDKSIPPSLASQAGLITAGIVSGKQFAYLRNEAGSICPGSGTLFEFQGIRSERLANLPIDNSCTSTRIYQGTTVYTFQTNGSMIYLDLSYNLLTDKIPIVFGTMKYLLVLNLGHNMLTGQIPDSFGGLKKIGVLDLSNNNLTGPIPGSLGADSFLNDLDVSNNNLSGQIPAAGQLTTFPPSRYANNSGLCGAPLPRACEKSPAPSNSSAGHRGRALSSSGFSLLIGVALSVLILLSLALALFKIKKHRKKAEEHGVGIGGGYIESVQTTSGSSSSKLSTSELAHLSINVAAFEKHLRKLTFAHLVEATSNFSAESLIGSGGFGEVYHARLKDGAVVAVKKLIHVTGQGDREFTAEMETIGKIKHRNLVPLLGYCKVGDERLLVYEYMCFGSLDVALHDSKSRAPGAPILDWSARKKIAIGSARGLAFLHHSCIPHIIHRDMKSSNVLIDENLDARVSDFGMARLMNALDTHLSVSTLAGTPGYVPPEYYQSFRCTTKGDVYSYGVVLLELLSGKKPIDTMDFGDNNLVGWAKQLVKENRSADIFDPDLVQGSKTGEIDELHKYLKIAFECLEDRPLRRPTMIQVMAMFKELQMDADGSSGSDVLDGLSIRRSVIEESA